MSELLLALRVTADGKLAVRELSGVEAGERALANQTRKTSQTTQDSRTELERYMVSLRKQVDTLGLSAAQVRLYEAARLGATQADLRAIQVSNQLIAANESNAALMGALTGKIAALVSVASAIALAHHLAESGDQAVLLRARIGNVTSGLEEQKAVIAELFAIAQQLELPFNALAAQFPKLAGAVKYYGMSTKEAIDLFRLLAITTKIAGKEGEDAALYIGDFARALQDGAFQGREVKQMLSENAPLARALAAGLGVTASELKRMGDEGLLTAQNVTKALLSQQQAIETGGAKVPKTIAGGWDALVNEMKRAEQQSGTLTQAQAALVAVMERMRELVEYGRTSGWGSPISKLTSSVYTATHDVPAPKAAPQLGNTPDPAKALDAAQGALRSLILQADTVSGINARFDQELRKLNDDILKLQVAGGYDARAQTQYQELIGQAYLRRQLSMEALAQKGVASQQSEIEALRKRSELETAASVNYHDIQQDSIRRALEAEEFYHAAALTSEREYINRKAELQTQAAQGEIDKLSIELERQQDLLTKLREQRAKAPTPTAAKQVEGQILDQEKKVGDARTQLTVATRNLEGVEVTRGRNSTLAEKKISDAVRALTRDREDYERVLAREIADMELQIELIGKDELAQAKANKQRELRNRYEDKYRELQRKFEDLQTHGGSAAELEAVANQMVTLNEESEKLLETWGKLIDKQFAANFTADLSRSITDALVDGGKDAWPNMRKAMEEAFKKPIKAAIQGVIQGGMDSIFKFIGGTLAPGVDLTAFMQGPGGIAAGLGGIGGGLLGQAAGAGQRGQMLAANYGATGAAAGAMVGTYVFPGIGTVVGAAIGGIIGALAGIFSDPSGDAPRTGRFGAMTPGHSDRDGYWAPAGGSRTTPFGTVGFFNESWFDDNQMGKPLKDFLDSLSKIETQLAGMLTPDDIGRARTAVTGNQEYGFGLERSADFQATLSIIIRDRMTAIVEAVMPGFGHIMAAAQGAGEDFVNLAQALFGLRDAGKSLDDIVMKITGTATDMVKLAVGALDKAVTTAHQHVAEALDAKDPTKLYAAEQELTKAILDRYQAEIQMVTQLRDAIQQLKEEAFQFQLSIAQKINSVGGSIDIAGMALGRANSLRPGVGGNANLAGQIRDVNSYVGAIDTWYQERRSAIERQMAQEQEAGAAIARAQQAAAQARVAQLQGELQLAKQFQGVVDRTSQMLDDMRLGSSSPLPLSVRMAMAQGDVAGLMSQYRGASGSSKVDLANQLLDALQTYRGLGQEGTQRPSPEWEAIYNEIMADLTAVKVDAKSVAERSVDLEQAILEVQQQAASYAAIAANAGVASSGALDALNTEALGYYEWAQKEGDRLYKEQLRQHNEQLDAITGGQEVELFIAARQREAVEELKELNRQIKEFLAAIKGEPLGTGAPAGGGGGDGADAGGSGAVNPAARGDTIIIHLPTGMTSTEFMDLMQQNAPAVRRAIVTS